MNFLLQPRKSTTITPLYSLPLQPLKNQISELPPREEIECPFSYPRSALPDLGSPLFRIIIPLLMIVVNRRVKPTAEPQTPCHRYLDLKACVRKMKLTLERIKPLIDELTYLEGKQAQQWNWFVYEDYHSDLDVHLKMIQSNRSDYRAFSALEQDIPYFVEEIKKEHRLKSRGKDHLLNAYRLFSNSRPGAMDQKKSFATSHSPASNLRS